MNLTTQKIGVKIMWSALALLLIGLGYWAGAQRSGNVVTQPTARAPLFYRNPMGLPDTSPAPKKDAMGMDYIPVFAGDEQVAAGDNAQLKISVDKVQKLGVKSVAVSKQIFSQTVRAVGRIEPNERSIHVITPKFEGWVETLHVDATGDEVHAGQALFEVYSPELVSAQREYLIALQGVAAMKDAAPEALANMNNLVNSSLARLKNWDISPAELRQLRESGAVKHTIPYRSPVRGIVLEKMAVKGMRFMPGETLYKIADLSKLWIMVDVFEQDIAALKIGQAAQVSIDAFPGRVFATRVSYIYPTLNEQTRTARVRLELNNTDGQLRPGMYAQALLSIKNNQQAVLSVPDSAVIYSGSRELVLVDLGAGKFAPRTVKLGRQSDDQIEILAGVSEGEKVVTSANFLIDAESNLKAAIAGFGENSSASSANMPAATIQKTQTNAAVTHRAVGVVDAVEGGTITITHSPIASLNWPDMSMNFKLAHADLVKGIKLGNEVDFEFVERAAGVWEVVKITQSAPAAINQKGR